jgi:hypothetical protein
MGKELKRKDRKGRKGVRVLLAVFAFPLAILAFKFFSLRLLFAPLREPPW